MFDADSASDSRLQRSHGAVRLAFAARDGRSYVTERYGSAPARVLTPNAFAGPPEAVLANTAGGVAGGDTLTVQATVADGAEALVSGQAAEKIYRAIDAAATIETRLDIGLDATLEWLPQETILFDGAALDRRIDIDLADGAKLLLSEMIVLGRQAMGERFDHGHLADRWRINVGGRPIWRESLRLEGGGPALASPIGMAGARALATVFYAGPNAADMMEPARDWLGPAGGATLVRGLFVARIAGAEAGPLKARLSEFIAKLRAAALGRPPAPPRVWSC